MSVPVAGTYSQVYTFTGYQDRAFSIATNGGGPMSTGPVHSGGWESVAKGSMEVPLKAGNNSVVFGNAAGWANDLDAIRLERRHAGELGARSGAATVTGCAQCIGTSGVQLAPGAAVTFADAAASTTGNKTIHIDYAAAAASSIRLSSGSASVVVQLPATGGAQLTGLRTTGLTLPAGVNTLKVEGLTGTVVLDQVRVTA